MENVNIEGFTFEKSSEVNILIYGTNVTSINDSLEVVHGYNATVNDFCITRNTLNRNIWLYQHMHYYSHLKKSMDYEHKVITIILMAFWRG